MILKNRLLPLNGAYNVRDLGGYQAQTYQTQWQRFLRSDNLSAIDENDRRGLQDYGLKTVIDLRTDHELVQAPNPFQNDSLIDYHHVSLFADLNPAEFMQHESPLTSFYLKAVSENGDAFSSIFNIMANAAKGTILFHCTIGKDRTGLVAALILLNGGVSHSDILADYALTDHYIKPLISKILKNVDLDPNIEKYKKALECDISAMNAVLNAINHQYHGLDNWFQEIGVDHPTQVLLKDRLLKQNFTL